MNANIEVVRNWALVVSTVLSIALTIWRVRDALGLGSLHVRLTKEVFFRLNETGESLFLNAVLLVRNGAIEIVQTEAELCRISGSQKQYQVDLVLFGEKTKHQDGVRAEHYFPSRSPAEFIPANTARRVVYMGVINEYRSDVLRAFSHGQEAGRALRSAVAAAKNEGEINADLEAAFTQAASDTRATFMQAIQIEPGRYTLALRVRFRRVGIWARKIRVSESKIEFEMPEGIRAHISDGVSRLAQVLVASNAQPEVNQLLPFPEYNPTKVDELT